MTPQERKVMELALEALENLEEHLPFDWAFDELQSLAGKDEYRKDLAKARSLIPVIYEALAQPEQCTGCEGKPSNVNNPCTVCGKSQPEQRSNEHLEPVAWGNFKEDGTLVGLSQHQEDQANWFGRKPLYTTPPQPKEPEQEPVAYLVYDHGASSQYLAFDDELGDMDECEVTPLYTTPPQRTWFGLTDEDIDDAEIHLTSCRNNHESWIEGIQEFAQAIEAKLREKNQ